MSENRWGFLGACHQIVGGSWYEIFSDPTRPYTIKPKTPSSTSSVGKTRAQSPHDCQKGHASTYSGVQIHHYLESYPKPQTLTCWVDSSHRGCGGLKQLGSSAFAATQHSLGFRVLAQFRVWGFSRLIKRFAKAAKGYKNPGRAKHLL